MCSLVIEISISHHDRHPFLKQYSVHINIDIKQFSPLLRFDIFKVFIYFFEQRLVIVCSKKG